jgi:hypothetical protein
MTKPSFCFSDPLLPQYFYVPEENLAEERAEPTTQSRMPSVVSFTFVLGKELDQTIVKIPF